MASNTTYFIDTSTFATATAVWSDSQLTTKAPDGWYQASAEDANTYRQQTGGVLGTAANCECPVACGNNVEGSGAVGSYIVDVDMGNTSSDVGAIVVYFQPYNIPDGILATYDSSTYNTLTTNTHGLEQATAGEINFVGTPITGCTASDLQGNSFTVNNFVYNGGTFVDQGTTTTINIPASGTVNLNATGNIYYTMVIPKPNATPANLRLQLVGVCTSTAFRFKAFCPTALPSFTTNTVQTTDALACGAAQDQTYYFAQNSSTTASNPLVVDSNTVPQVGNFVFSNSTGATALTDGFYKLSSTTVAQVVSGVVTAVTTCPTYNAFNSSDTNTTALLACNDSIDQVYFHSGNGIVPVTGENAYSDSAGNNPLGAGFYKTSNTQYIEVIDSTTGEVSGPSNFSLGTSFSASTSQGSDTNACASSLTVTLYHDGSGTLPVASDTVYTDACKSSPVGNGYRLIDTSGGGQYMYITGNNGVVQSIGNCQTCTMYVSSQVSNFNQICGPGASPVANQNYYHNGSGSYPVTGDTVYSAIGCTTTLGAGYYYLYTVGQTNYYIIVNSSGVVTSDTNCIPQ